MHLEIVEEFAKIKRCLTADAGDLPFIRFSFESSSSDVIVGRHPSMCWKIK